MSFLAIQDRIIRSGGVHDRSLAIENFNEQFKGIFDAHGQVPTKGLINTRRFALGAIFVYQLALQHRFEQSQNLRVGLKPFLKAA